MIQQDQRSRSLRYSLLATRVGSALAAADSGLHLTDRDKSAIESARTFLLSALHGRELTQGTTVVNEQALDASEAYGEAIDASLELLRQGVLLPEGKDAIVLLINRFAQALDQLRQNEKASEDTLTMMRSFFGALRKMTLEVGDVMERVSVEEAKSLRATKAS